MRDMARPSLRNFRAKFSEMSFPLIQQIGHCFLRQQFKMFDSNNFTLSSMHSFQNVWPIKRKAVYTLLLFHIFIHLLVRIRSDHNSLAYF